MLEQYKKHQKEREAQGIYPKPLSKEQTQELIKLLSSNNATQELYQLLTCKVAAGVDEAAEVKADFLYNLALEKVKSPVITPEKAVTILGTMLGGYNIQPLIDLLDHATLAKEAAKALSGTILIFDKFSIIEEKANQGNEYARLVVESWAKAEWFEKRKLVAEKITVTVFKVIGETNTDDLSPATEAWSRPDIPLHALSMLRSSREGVSPDKPDVQGPIKQLNELKQKGFPIAYVGDVVGTGSSRKSATNSILWHLGEDIPYVPNKRFGGYVLANKIAPIFFNTLEDSGALPIELDVNDLATGDIIDIYPYAGEIRKHSDNSLITNFELKTNVILDEVRAGGRIPLIIGRHLTEKARKSLGLKEGSIFQTNPKIKEYNFGYTLAQKIIGKACGIDGVRPGQYCEPKISAVGSQDTTGGMTRDELKDLACLKFSADLVMQSFCHTSAYPKEVDIKLQETLPDFMTKRGGVVLKPGDGIIHSWLNRMILPDQVGTGGDSHTRFPLGISFPAGSGLVAFASATGSMPLDMPESVLVRFHGEMQEGITLRDLVHAIPYFAKKQGLLTIDKKGKKNVFSGRVLEIEGLSTLSVEQAFELTDASAERSTAACTINLDESVIKTYIKSNITLLKWMIEQGYVDKLTLSRRIKQMEDWLKDPKLLKADKDAQYYEIIDIDLSEIKEPILCAPNDPDDVRLLSEVADTKIDEVFIGSCMTNIGHFRATGTLLEQYGKPAKSKLWITPPTKMDAKQLMQEGYFNKFINAGARIESAGCSLCMGNQARVDTGTTVVSTSTRNFPNRLGKDTKVFLASAELAAVSAILGKLPSLQEYKKASSSLKMVADKTYKYLSFDQIPEYQAK